MHMLYINVANLSKFIIYKDVPKSIKRNKFDLYFALIHSAFFNLKFILNINQKKILFKNFLFGFGYRFRYIDIPVLESFINFGFIGFLLYLSFNVILLVFSIKAFKSERFILFPIFLN